METRLNQPIKQPVPKRGRPKALPMLLLAICELFFSGNSGWKLQLSALLDNEVSLGAARDALLATKAAGAAREEVRDYLFGLLGLAGSELTEDRVLEILDLVEGWCQERYWVW